MSAPLLFLDFDGVLHPASPGRAPHFSRQHLLAKTVQESPCRIVISSSWRHHHEADELRRHFTPDLRARMVGATGPAVAGRWACHQEILQYLRAHDPQAPWRALDDAWFEFPPQCPQLILCDPNTGMGEREAQQLSAWLAHVTRPPG